jgi:hypothetical protein
METKNDPSDKDASRVEDDESQRERGPTFAEPEQPVVDLTSEIVATISRSPGERVTCRRIVGNNYRCNWWAAGNTHRYDNPTMSGLTVTTHRVVRSQMLRITRSKGQLVFEEVVQP